jgi:hypothetical protein
MVVAAVGGHGGKICQTSGDTIIANGFPDADEAVLAAVAVQRRLTRFNNESSLDFSLAVRIGVASAEMSNTELRSDCGEPSTDLLNEAGHLEKECPPGGIRISRRVHQALLYGRNSFRPALDLNQGDTKALSKDSFVWIERSHLRGQTDIMPNLTDSQRQAYPPVFLTPGYYKRVPYTQGFRDLSTTLANALVVLGETRDDRGANYPVSHPATTSDAVGILEALACLAPSSGVIAAIDEWADTLDVAHQLNLVVVGSPTVNLYAHAINATLPAGFIEGPDRPLQLRVAVDSGDAKRFPERIEHSSSDRNYGLVMTTHSPLNPDKQLLWIAGISGMGTQAAARFVRDLIRQPDNTIEQVEREAQRSTNSDESQPANVVIVKPSFGAGFNVNHYIEGGWRITGYKIVWAGNCR